MGLRILIIAFGALMWTGASTAAPAGWKTFHDAARGFSISYPAGWRLNPNYDDQGYGYAQGELSDHITGVLLSPPATLQPDTNLLPGESYVLIEILRRTPEKCVAQDFIVDPPMDYRIYDEQHGGDRALLASGDPGDMAEYEDSVTVRSHAPCLGVHEVIASEPADGFGKDEPPFNRAAMTGLLDSVVATLTLR